MLTILDNFIYSTNTGTQAIYDLIKTKDKVIKYCAESDAFEAKVDLATYEWFRQNVSKGLRFPA